jgi:hypothetical protein
MLLHRNQQKGKRQRFYARNTVNTTLPRRSGAWMRSFSLAPADFQRYERNSRGAFQLPQPGKILVFMQLFRFGRHYCGVVWRN